MPIETDPLVFLQSFILDGKPFKERLDNLDPDLTDFQLYRKKRSGMKRSAIDAFYLNKSFIRGCINY